MLLVAGDPQMIPGGAGGESLGLRRMMLDGRHVVLGMELGLGLCNMQVLTAFPELGS